MCPQYLRDPRRDGVIFLLHPVTSVLQFYTGDENFPPARAVLSMESLATPGSLCVDSEYNFLPFHKVPWTITDRLRFGVRALSGLIPTKS
ncbi:hypothetical protein PoB_006068900 [Plakobranchus ocellatus]|uniref:Uncharacterized protein n=1 Tax=Plakobranchus ocellatus TaxID=259542 RepID=A0AAV4CQQ3_9GAST|nr:hypothetical protein PoB_006068900 [Plakobranchus ocellatus]